MSATAPPSDRPRPVVLCILDGWGERDGGDDNAIALGDTPNWDRYVATAPRARLDASAEDVGLPSGQMGNSEVGHMNIGAGRVVKQDLPRIDAAIADGSLTGNGELIQFADALRQSGGTCHLMGLLSPGGVHSHQDHMAELVRTLDGLGIPVRLHAFLDGRDTPPRSGQGYMETFLTDVALARNFTVATVSGRYYAMDRDKRWERVELAYRALAAGEGEQADDAVAAIVTSYDNDLSDEFMPPTVIGSGGGMQDGDGLLMANFRADRAREILAALADPGFDGFKRETRPELVARLGMVEYSVELNEFYQVMFEPIELDGILGQIVADAGLRQLRIAETEKYAHVTFFLNGGREEEFAGEERVLIPSPRIATYDLQPEMSAVSVTDSLVDAIKGGTFDLIVVNFANGDMVGHTGILDAAVKATTAVDVCLGRLEAAVRGSGGVLMVTADHGNCEMMANPDKPEAHTAHTTNPVPILTINAPDWVTGMHDGRLCDVAPTVLKLMGLEQPAEMTGQSLIDGDVAPSAAAQ